jgi:hypothetical protein
MTKFHDGSGHIDAEIDPSTPGVEARSSSLQLLAFLSRHTPSCLHLAACHEGRIFRYQTHTSLGPEMLVRWEPGEAWITQLE